MRTFLVLLAVLLSPTLVFAAEYQYGKPIQHENLTLVPVYPAANTPELTDEYLTFSEASDRGLIVVTELNGSTSDAQVEAVHVTSKAKDPILLLAGEVILGGKQDRIISTNTIIEPGTNKLKVAVFCVEAGRWDGRKADFKSSKKVAHGKLRTTAVFDEDQQKVWAEVKAQNEKSKVAPSTGTYRATLNQKDVNADVERAMKALLPALKADKRALGIVVAIDGEIRGVDAFANPNLFAKMRDQLVRSYALAAVSSEAKDGRALAKSDLEGLNKRIDDKRDAEEASKASGEAANTYEQSPSKKRAVTRTKDGKKVHDFVTFE